MYAYNQISIYIFRCKLIICVWVYFISLLFPGTFSHIFPKLFSKNLVLNICVTFMVVVLVTQLSDSDPMDCSPPGSSVHGILQAGKLEWVVMPATT